MFLGNVSLLENGKFSADLMLIEYNQDILNQIFDDQSEIEIFNFVMEGGCTYAILHTFKIRLLQRRFKKYIWQTKFSIRARLFREIHGRWPTFSERKRIYKKVNYFN